MSDQVRHPLAARLFAREVGGIDARGAAEHRRRLLDGVAGHVLEIGAGTGISFADYPAAVTALVAAEPEPYLRGLAQDAARRAPVPVTVIDAPAEQLPLPDDAFDAAVAARVLCSVHDLGRALAELSRVVRPGGELRFYEHVVSDRPPRARAQRALDLIWPHLAGGCHTSRDTTRAIIAAGFEIERSERFHFRPTPLAAPTSTYVLGLARRR